MRRPADRAIVAGVEVPVRVLLIEDESELAEWLSRALAQSGFRVDWADGAALGLTRARAESFDAVVLDLGLPDKDGHEVIRSLRSSGERIPILVLTARGSLAEKVSTLGEGADDFLAKPFAIEELEARLLALTRRARGIAAPRLDCGPLGYDASTRVFRLCGKPLCLSPREQALLFALIQRTGEPMSKSDLTTHIFSDEVDVLPEAVEVIVHRLRKRLAGSTVRIVTLRGLGYCLESLQPDGA